MTYSGLLCFSFEIAYVSPLERIVELFLVAKSYNVTGINKVGECLADRQKRRKEQ